MFLVYLSTKVIDSKKNIYESLFIVCEYKKIIQTNKLKMASCA